MIWGGNRNNKEIRETREQSERDQRKTGKRPMRDWIKVSLDRDWRETGEILAGDFKERLMED